MNILETYRVRGLAAVSIFLFVFVTGCASSSSTAGSGVSAEITSSDVRAVRPGAPGQSSQVLKEADVPGVSSLPYTDADVHFMQGMIAHHAQALEMTALVAARSNRRDLALLSKRIEISQKSEIQLMQTWLRDHNEVVPEASAHQMMGGKHVMMPGMLTPSQMDELALASGDSFYRLFLANMIGHHEGALFMVSELLSSPGAAQDTFVFKFASDVDVDQRMEIARMRDMMNSIR